MQVKHLDRTAKKGWYLGPWNSDLPVSIGYAYTGVDEPHVHARIAEVYLVASGTAELRLERKTISLEAGDLVLVEPGEAHTFSGCSPDYRHFVIHIPGLAGEEAHTEKSLVSRARLGL